MNSRIIENRGAGDLDKIMDSKMIGDWLAVFYSKEAQ